MSTLPAISDEVLSAWLDGELDEAQRIEVEQWLAQHPDEAARVRLWAADRDALRARLEPVLDEPVPPALERRVREGSGQAPAWARWGMAAAVAAFAVGAGVGAGAAWQWRGQTEARLAEARAATPTAWVQRAALAHRVFTAEQRHPVEVNLVTTAESQRAEQEAHLQRWLTRRVDLPVKLFNLDAHGFELVGGRLLPDGPNGVSALLMYERAGGSRITVTLRRCGESVPAAFRYVQQDGLGLFYWVEGQAGYALAGPLPREQLLTLAQAIYAQQPAGVPASRR